MSKKGSLNCPPPPFQRQLSLPPSFPDEAVRRAYQSPEVDNSREEFEWGKPDLDLLRKYPPPHTIFYRSLWEQFISYALFLWHTTTGVIPQGVGWGYVEHCIQHEPNLSSVFTSRPHPECNTECYLHCYNNIASEHIAHRTLYRLNHISAISF